MIHAGPAKPPKNAGAICSAKGPPNPTKTQVPYVPRRARELPQKRGCHMLRPHKIAGAICSTQGPPNPKEIKVLYVATPQKRRCLMFHAGPAKPQRNQGALCCDLILGKKRLNALCCGLAGCARINENPPNCIDTPPRRLGPWALGPGAAKTNTAA